MGGRAHLLGMEKYGEGKDLTWNVGQRSDYDHNINVPSDPGGWDDGDVGTNSVGSLVTACDLCTAGRNERET